MPIQRLVFFCVIGVIAVARQQLVEAADSDVSGVFGETWEVNLTFKTKGP